MAETLAQYTANTGVVSINVQNPNRDGTGTMGTVLTAAANGTLINSITIKAVNNTTQGMVRLFIDNGTSIMLFQEYVIPASVPSGTQQSYEVTSQLGFTLQSGYILKASTETSNTFIVSADAVDWSNCAC